MSNDKLYNIVTEQNMFNQTIERPARLKFGDNEGKALTAEANNLVRKDARIPPTQTISTTDTPMVTIKAEPPKNAPTFVPFAQVDNQVPTIQSLISVAKELRRQMNELNAQGINVLIYSDTFGCEISDWKVKIDTEI